MKNNDRYAFDDLKSLMERLRDPETGCPWDRKQDFNTIKSYTVEEAYEVADAVERDNMNDLKDELGDLLFQIIFHSQMAAEKGHFTIDDVIHHVTDKMIFRHPHVFDANTQEVTADHIEQIIWQDQKAKEKAAKGPETNDKHYLDDVTLGLPSLLLANKIQKRVHKVGFEFETTADVISKLSEELDELNNAQTDDEKQEEYGDVLFVAALLATKIKVNPEDSLRLANLKFINRFNAMEDDLKLRGITLDDATIEDMTKAWDRIKADSRKLS